MKMTRNSIRELAANSVYFLDKTRFREFEFVIDDITRPWYFVSAQTLILKLRHKSGKLFAAKIYFNDPSHIPVRYQRLETRQPAVEEELLPALRYIQHGFGWNRTE